MSKYATPALKQTIIAISGCIGFCQTLTEAAPKEISSAKMKQRLKWACDHLFKVLEALEDGLDQDSLEGIIRFCKRTEMLIMPKSDSRLQHDYLLVKEDEMRELLSQCTECGICLKNETEVKQCQTRKQLARMGLVSKDVKRHVCPYQP